MNDEMLNRFIKIVKSLSVEDIAKALDEHNIEYSFKFKPNDVVRYIGGLGSVHDLDEDKLYVVNASEMYGNSLFTVDTFYSNMENFLISNAPEMFTLVYREGV